MEEKQFDPYQFIGFILIAMILTWMLFKNQNTPLPEESEIETNKVVTSEVADNDKESSVKFQNKLTYGMFSELMNPTEIKEYTLENEDLKVKISSRGANLILVNLKNYTNYLKLPLNLITDNNHTINTIIKSRMGLTLETKNIFFKEFKFINTENEKSLLLSAKIDDIKYIQFKYTLPKNGFKLNLEIKTEGFEDFLSSDNIKFNWQKELFRNSKSIDYENRYTQLTYAYEDDKTDNLSLSGEDKETEYDIRWISYRQHFFSSILIPEKVIDKVTFSSFDITADVNLDTVSYTHLTLPTKA